MLEPFFGSINYTFLLDFALLCVFILQNLIFFSHNEGTEFFFDAFGFSGSLVNVADHEDLCLEQVKVVFFVFEVICHLHNGPLKLAVYW